MSVILFLKYPFSAFFSIFSIKFSMSLTPEPLYEIVGNGKCVSQKCVKKKNGLFSLIDSFILLIAKFMVYFAGEKFSEALVFIIFFPRLYAQFGKLNNIFFIVGIFIIFFNLLCCSSFSW